MMTADLLYLDHAATTPLRPEARAAMEPFGEAVFGNPASGHAAGRAARSALEEARERVAAAIGAGRSEIVFTGGGTEADNLAVLGRWRARRGGVVISAVEHSAVRRSAARAAAEGAALTIVAVDENGRLDLAALDEALEDHVGLVSVMWGNNEVGTLQPVREVAARCEARGAVFHTDAVQAIGHVPVRVDATGAGLLAMSAHKFGGPRGVGALYVREGIELQAILHGGGQEGGLRSGTSNVAGAVGMAAALERAVAGVEAEAVRLGRLRDELEATLLEAVPDLRVHGAEADRLPHVSSIGMDGVPADVLVASLDMAGVAISTGSACRSGGSEPSPVLLAMGREADAVVRFSLGWTTTTAEVRRAASTFIEVVERSKAVAS